MTRRWLFADQLGPHFLDDPADDLAGPGDDHGRPVLLIESRAVFARRRWHRQKAHLVLSALRHRAAELGERAEFVQARTYREGLDRAGGRAAGPLTVCQPTSWAADAFVRSLEGVEVLPARGFATDRDTFERWAAGQRGLLMENFYRDARRRLDLLMDGGDPAGGRWNLDAENREPPPKGAARLGVPPPWRPEEDDIDARVREDLDRWERDGDVSFVGRDGPRRFAATRTATRRWPTACCRRR
jgi:deoxyribodipyrimidine photolyase-related protein